MSCICMDVGKTPNSLKVYAHESGHQCSVGGGGCVVFCDAPAALCHGGEFQHATSMPES